jgi:hypothetical protein
MLRSFSRLFSRFFIRYNITQVALFVKRFLAHNLNLCGWWWEWVAASLKKPILVKEWVILGELGCG